MMERRSSIGDRTDQTPENSITEQKQSQIHLHSLTNTVDQPHECHDVPTNRRAGGGSDLTNEDELSPEFINPVIYDQDGSNTAVHRAVLPQSIGEEHEVFDVGNSTYSKPRLTSFGEQAPPLSTCKSAYSTTGVAFTPYLKRVGDTVIWFAYCVSFTVFINSMRKFAAYIISYCFSYPVLSEGASVSSQSSENNKKNSSSDGSDPESHKKRDIHLDLLSPMREEKGLLATKAVSTS